MNRNAVFAGIAIGLMVLYNNRQRGKPPKLITVPNRPGGFNAQTVPPIGIFIQEKHLGNQELIDHELRHWNQYMSQGLIPYYFRYITELANYGYDNMPMEMEARANESEWVKRNYTQSVRNGASRTVYNPNFRR